MKPQPPQSISLSPVIPPVKCIDYGFRQHTGECWIDSIQMFFCFQDGIKEIVQPKLHLLSPEQIISLAESSGRRKLLPKMYDNEELYQSTRVLLLEYLDLLKKRFILYYSKVKSYSDPASPSLAINIGQCAFSMSLLNSFYGNKLQRVTESGGGDKDTEQLIIILLSYCFLDKDDDLFINYKNKEGIEIKDADDLLGSLIELNLIRTGEGHATLFFECNNIKYHYDDNDSMSDKLIQQFNYIDSYFKVSPLPKIPTIYGPTYQNADFKDFTIRNFLLIYKFDEKYKNIKLENFLMLEIDKNKITKDSFCYYTDNITEYTKFNEIIEFLIERIIGFKNEYISCSFIHQHINTKVKFTYTFHPYLNIKYSSTFLLKACERGNLTTVDLLIKAGANPNFINDDDGFTALIWAVRQNHLEVVRLLLRLGVKDIINNIDKTNNNALSLSIINNNLEIVKELFKHGANPNFNYINNDNLLLLAIDNNYVEIVKELLNNSIDIHYKNSITSETPLLKAIKSNNLNIVIELLNHGINISEINSITGDTPLILAIKSNNLNIVIELLNRGVNIDEINSITGDTPLMLAIKRRYFNIVSELLKRGAKTDILNKKTGDDFISLFLESKENFSNFKLIGGSYFNKYLKYLNKQR
jgi:ankyrin repeat protein